MSDSMNANVAPAEEGPTPEKQALTGLMTVIADLPAVRDSSDRYACITESGKQYDVNVAAETCTCPDHKYRDDVSRCKHVHRVRYATGLARVPVWINEDAVDGDLGAFVPTKRRPSAADTDAHSDAKVTTDGGAVVREAADDAEILNDNTSEPWKGPFSEFDKYGTPTGAEYVRCRDCGREVIAERKSHTSHREGCRFGGDH